MQNNKSTWSNSNSKSFNSNSNSGDFKSYLNSNNDLLMSYSKLIIIMIKSTYQDLDQFMKRIGIDNQFNTIQHELNWNWIDMLGDRPLLKPMMINICQSITKHSMAEWLEKQILPAVLSSWSKKFL